MEKKLNNALKIIKNSKSIVALTGAGISTSAGIPDFRGPKGIYSKNVKPEDLFGYENFLKNPLPFWQFSRNFLTLLKKATPTKMHLFLAKLEETGKNLTIITQNIDGLHQIAGNKNVIEFHGTLQCGYCVNCHEKYTLAQMKKKLEMAKIPRCDKCQGLIKPDIVFFGEPVKGFEESFRKIQEADLMLIIGTTLTIAPASVLPQYFNGTIITINKGSLAYLPDSDIFLDIDIEKAAQFFLDNI